MKRALFATMLITSLALGTVVLTATAQSGSTPQECQGSEPANSTVKELCERIEQQQKTINDLRTKNNKLQNKVVKLEGEVQQLQFQLNQTSNDIPPKMAQRMRKKGAYDPRRKAPALIIIRDYGWGPVVYQWVGPGNGEHSFNGRNAWTRVAESPKKNTMSNFTWSVAYTPPGTDATYTSNSLAEMRRQLNTLRESLNSPQGFVSATTYINRKYQSTKRLRLGALSAMGFGVVFAFLLGMYANRGKKGALDAYLHKWQAAKEEAQDTNRSTLKVLLGR